MTPFKDVIKKCSDCFCCTKFSNGHFYCGELDVEVDPKTLFKHCPEVKKDVI